MARGARGGRRIAEGIREVVRGYAPTWRAVQSAFLAIAVLSPVLLTGCGSESPATKSVTAVSLMPPDGAFGSVDTDFAVEVAALTAGSLIIEPRTLAESDIALTELFDAVDAGRVPLAIAPPAAYWIDGEPLSIGPLLVSGIPFGFGAEEFMAWYYAAGGQELVQDIVDRRSLHGNVLVLPIAVTAGEPAGFFVDAVADDPDVFNASGITYRINLLGAKAMRVAFPNLDIVDSPPGVVPVDAMCSADIQGAELGTLSVYPVLFFDRFSHERGDNVIECGFRHLYLSSWQQPMLSNWVIINRSFFAALAPHEQQAIRSAAMANVIRTLANDLARSAGTIDRVVSAGGTIHAALPPAVLQRLRDAVVEVLQRESDADPDFAAIVNSLRAFAKDHHATLLYDDVPADERFNLFPGWRPDVAIVAD